MYLGTSKGGISISTCSPRVHPIPRNAWPRGTYALSFVGFFLRLFPFALLPFCFLPCYYLNHYYLINMRIFPCGTPYLFLLYTAPPNVLCPSRAMWKMAREPLQDHLWRLLCYPGGQVCTASSPASSVMSTGGCTSYLPR